MRCMSRRRAAMRRSSSASCGCSCSSDLPRDRRERLRLHPLDFFGSSRRRADGDRCIFARSVRRSASDFVSSSTAVLRSGDVADTPGMLSSCSGVMRTCWAWPSSDCDGFAVAPGRLGSAPSATKKFVRPRVLVDKRRSEASASPSRLDQRSSDLEFLELAFEALHGSLLDCSSCSSSAMRCRSGSSS